jgi:hypothetical protein
MDTLAFPIRFDSTGLKKHTHHSDDYFRQLLSFTALTEPGTHPLKPEFGVFDPSFQNVNRGAFILQASRYIPEIAITDVATEITSASNTSFLQVTYRRVS